MITFTISDLAYLLGKSPVTIRGWERKGEIALPRDSGGTRKVTPAQVREVAITAYNLARITDNRRGLIEASMMLLEQLDEDRTHRSTRVRQV